jgi:hypothetical protein
MAGHSDEASTISPSPTAGAAQVLHAFDVEAGLLAVTLNSAPHHASNRQANTLQSGTLSRS